MTETVKGDFDVSQRTMIGREAVAGCFELASACLYHVYFVPRTRSEAKEEYRSLKKQLKEIDFIGSNVNSGLRA